jgi:hypothetical protein
VHVTFILKNLSEAFYAGNGGSIAGLDSLTTAAEKFAYVRQTADAGALQVTMRIGNGAFRDKVELNALLRGECQFTFRLAPRRGYKLATFDITAVGKKESTTEQENRCAYPYRAEVR